MCKISVNQSTAHRYLNRFGKWHVEQLDRVNTQVLLAHGESSNQDIAILDVDSQTHTLESRKREKAVVGRNRKKPGNEDTRLCRRRKPVCLTCMQWNVGFVRGEAVSQRLMAGNTHGNQSLQSIIKDVRKKLGNPIAILRLDGGYLSKETLNYVKKHRYHLCMAARYEKPLRPSASLRDWIMAQGISVDENKWQRFDNKTRLYELGVCPVISTSPHQFRTILVEKEQEPFPGSKSQKKILRYGIMSRCYW